MTIQAEPQQQAKSGRVKVFVRIKPTDHVHPGYETPNERQIQVPHYDNNTEAVAFRFNRIFDANASQAEVFHVVGRDAVTNAISGMNSTIFAFGMTGSGKTYSMLGGSESLESRGLVPRCLSFLYQQLANKANDGTTYKISLNYVQIYQEKAYDLFTSPEYYADESLPKVTLSDDGAGGVKLRNCTEKSVASEEEAMSLLVWASNNRVVAETACNMESSRSHCILTVLLEARHPDGETVSHSKLHLVDLAGSERVAKTHAEGLLLKEACDINLSLHFLEQVISALHRGDEHVPYRNSVMTSILRDSLGGNCCTAMVATLTPEPSHLHEALQTCRFAQRVAAIKNTARVNVSVDPEVALKRMKKELAALRSELQFYKSEAGDEKDLNMDTELGPDEKEFCVAKVAAFVADDSNELPLNRPREVRGFMHVFRDQLIEANAAPKVAAVANPDGEDPAASAVDDEEMQQQLAARDAQLAYLSGMLQSKGCAKHHPLRATRNSEHEAPAKPRRRRMPGRQLRSSELPPARARPPPHGHHPVLSDRRHHHSHGGRRSVQQGLPARFRNSPYGANHPGGKAGMGEAPEGMEAGWGGDTDVKDAVKKAWSDTKSKRKGPRSEAGGSVPPSVCEGEESVNSCADENKISQGEEAEGDPQVVPGPPPRQIEKEPLLPYIGRDSAKLKKAQRDPLLPVRASRHAPIVPYEC